MTDATRLTGFVEGVGLLGPGLPDWTSGRALLARLDYEPDPLGVLVAPPPALLAANERRRAGLPTRLAFGVGSEAAAQAGVEPASLRAVFGSGNGEGLILHELIEQLVAGETLVSPTRFHNSVHNAVAGYWAIGAGSSAPFTCLGGGDETVAVTMLKALAEVAAERAPVLFCVYDAPLPAPLAERHPTDAPFAAALVLAPACTPRCLARIDARCEPGATAGRVLPLRNPAARALDLLRPIARLAAATIDLPLTGCTLRLDLAPCSTATRSSA